MQRCAMRRLVRLGNFARDALAGNLELDQALDLLQESALLGVAERDRVARLAGARRAADAVHVGLGLHRKVEVHHVGDVVDVESARRHVGCDEHGRSARTEGVKRANALVLRLVAVDRLCADVRRLQLAAQAVGTVLRLREDDGPLHAERLVEMHEELRLLRLQHEVELLVDAVDRARDRRHRHRDGVREQRVRKMADLLRHRRREEHGLPLLRQHRCDLANGLDEAHVEHAVGFVEHEEVDLGERDELLLEQVDQPARRRHEDVESLLDRADLRALAHAAEDDGEAKRRMPAIAREALGDLRRKFTRRRKHQRLRLAAERRTRVARQALEQMIEDRERERSRLAGSGLGDAEHVPALDGRRNRLGLDRGRMGVAVRRDGVEQGLRKLEIRERDRRERLRCRSGWRVGRHKHLSPADNSSGHSRGGIACGRRRRQTGSSHLERARRCRSKRCEAFCTLPARSQLESLASGPT